MSFFPTIKFRAQNAAKLIFHKKSCDSTLIFEPVRPVSVKRRNLHVPNLMQMRKIDRFRSFASYLAHVKCDV